VRYAFAIFGSILGLPRNDELFARHCEAGREKMSALQKQQKKAVTAEAISILVLEIASAVSERALCIRNIRQHAPLASQ